MEGSRAALAVLAACAVLLGSPLVAPAHAAGPLTTGFFDDVYRSTDAGDRSVWLSRTQAVGGSIVRLSLYWPEVAPLAPGGAADDPANPYYRWQRIDAAVRDASARGLRIVLTLTAAPTWAEGVGRPESAAPGSWRPNPAALGAFARAAARRYSGSFADPAVPGASLPRVRSWQVWNEPNLSTYLAPQWVRRGGHLVPESPAHFRAMLNQVYAAVKGVARDNFVVTGGTAPYGDPEPGGLRIMPVLFTRELFCLRSSRLRRVGCPNPPHLDAISHHPYGIRGPRSRALNADDVAVPDIGKLTRVLRAAERSGRALPRAHKQAWVTEIGWDSRPPDPQGVPAATQARWLEEAFYVLWRQGINTVTWFQIRDEAPNPSFAATSQSAVFLRDARPKLSAQAFRFPFVGDRVSRRLVRAWGKAPSSGDVLIQRRRRQRWATISRVRSVRAGGIFLRSFPLRGAAQLRAIVGSETSLIWRQR